MAASFKLVRVAAEGRVARPTTLLPVNDYWQSPEAMERKWRDRWLQTARPIVEQEPRQKRSTSRRMAAEFRHRVRTEVATGPGWPKPRAALALDLDFWATSRQPPAIWRLPKNYLDLLGGTTATAEDPGPVLYEDDGQVKLLYASLARSPAGSRGRIHVEARTRTAAMHDMQLAGELLELGELDDTFWAEADPNDLPGENEGDQPDDLAARMRFHDKAQYQAMVLGSNDRVLRSVFFRAARWLLTGCNADADRLHRLGMVGRQGVAELVTRMAETNAAERELLWSTIGIELPPLPVQHGGGAVFREAVRSSIHTFVERHPDLQPLVVPLRVSVLVVPPRYRRGRIKDLDNILIDVLSILEAEVSPNAMPWTLAPPLSEDGAEPAEVEARPPVAGSQTWAYHVMELHRGDNDPDEGSLVIVPGLAWNRRSIWVEASDFVAQAWKRLDDR